jgi:stringent starvation protein B
MARRTVLCLALAVLVAGCDRRPRTTGEPAPGATSTAAPAGAPDTTPRPPKLQVARSILTRKADAGEGEAPTMFVHLDPRRTGVVVPAKFAGDARLVLQVGYEMAVPITDLKIDEQGVSGTLSFDHRPFFCRVPWSAVFALVGEDGQGMTYPKDTPIEVEAETKLGPRRK